MPPGRYCRMPPPCLGLCLLIKLPAQRIRFSELTGHACRARSDITEMGWITLITQPNYQGLGPYRSRAAIVANRALSAQPLVIPGTRLSPNRSDPLIVRLREGSRQVGDFWLTAVIFE